MSRLKNILLAGMMVFSLGGAMATTVLPQTASAADSCAGSFLGFPAWYRGLTDGSCNIKSPEAVGGISTFIWRIALNCIEMAMVAIGYLAAFYLIYGGFLFMTSTGDPADAAKARKTMINAIAGLGISIVAVVVINFIFTKLLG